MMLARAGRALFYEAPPGASGGAASSNNPFKDGSFNLTDQMRLIRQDPETARRLIIAAGRDPADFRLG